MTNNNISKILIAILIIAVIFLGYKLYFKKPDLNENPVFEQILADSIASYQMRLEESQVREEYYHELYDSLEGNDVKIKYRTREKIKFIYGSTDPDVLDSIIRTVSSTRKPRYY